MAVVIRQIFPFSVTFGASTTATYTIGSGAESALADVTKTFMVFGVEVTGTDPQYGQIRGVVTNTTTLTFTRASGASGTPVVKGYVVEGTSGIAVDHGTMASFGAGEQTAALSNVTDLTKAFVLTSAQRAGSASNASSTHTARLFDSAGLKVGIESGDYNGGVGYIDQVSYQAVQYADCSVQRGSLSDLVITTGTTVTQAISAVTLAKSFLQVWYKADGTPQIEGDDLGIIAKFDTTTQISATRYNASEFALTGGSYEVVSFTDSTTVQHVTEALAAATTSGTNTLSALSDSGANAITLGTFYQCAGKSDWNTSDLYDFYTTCTVTSATNATVARGSSSANIDIVWQVIDFVQTTPPTVSVPTGYLATNNLAARTISQMRTPTPSNISVTAGTSAITLVTLTCISGKGVMTMTASGASAVGGNGTNAISIIGGSETDINNTLATFAFTGLEPTRENVTVAVLATDGTLNDTANLVLFNHRTSLTVVAASYADLVAMIQTAKMILPLGSTSGQVEIVAEDDDTLTDTQTITLNLITSATGFGVNQVLRRRRKKKSGN